MRGFWLFVHVSGFTLWLGAGMASMIAGVVAKRLAATQRLAVYKATGAIHRGLVLPGAVAAIVSGFVLAIPIMRGGGMRTAGWLHLMMTTGLLGFLVLLFVSVPAASKLGRLEPDARGELPEGFARLRKRQVIGASIAGGMGILAVIAGTIVRF
jgi:hypothetical protein